MPKEHFWNTDQAEGADPALTVSWGKGRESVTIGDVALDRSGVERLMRVLRRAHGVAFNDEDDDVMSRLVRSIDDLSLRMSSVEDALRSGQVSNTFVYNGDPGAVIGGSLDVTGSTSGIR